MTETKDSKDTNSPAPGLAVFGSMATGLVSIVGGLVALADGDFVGAGICFFAAATAFGVVTYVSFSK